MAKKKMFVQAHELEKGDVILTPKEDHERVADTSLFFHVDREIPAKTHTVDGIVYTEVPRDSRGNYADDKGNYLSFDTGDYIALHEGGVWVYYKKEVK